MYDKANVCRIANQLIKEGYTRSDAFVAAWQIEKGRVAKNMIQTPVQEVETAEETKETTATATEETLLNQVREYKEIKRMIEEMEAKSEEIKKSIIAEMEAKNTEEIKVDVFKVRYKTVVSNRFNTSEFKEAHSDLYKEYLKESSCKRFTVA